MQNSLTATVFHFKLSTSAALLLCESQSASINVLSRDERPEPRAADAEMGSRGGQSQQTLADEEANQQSGGR